MAELDVLANNTKFVELIPVLKKLFLAERDSTETSVALLEDQLTAVDIQTGAGVAKVVGGWAMWPLGLCSVGLVTMVVINLRMVTRKNLVPMNVVIAAA